MSKIKCFYYHCIHLDAGVCIADIIHLDPQTGCQEYSPLSLDQLAEKWDSEDRMTRDWARSDIDEWYGEDEAFDQDD